MFQPEKDVSAARDYLSLCSGVAGLKGTSGTCPRSSVNRLRRVHISESRPVLVKKFLAQLKAKKTPGGTPLSAKRIHNIMIPLRVIFKDACGEFDWVELPDPFAGLKLPQVKRLRIYPFTME